MPTEKPHPDDIEVRRTPDGGIEWSRPWAVAQLNRERAERFWAIFDQTPSGKFLKALRDGD